MTRKECLDMAAQCVLQDRASQYGGVEDNFRIIANFWSVYLGRKVYPADVAMMMALLKIARAKANPAHADSFVDLAGYAACGAELAVKAEAYRQSIEEAGAEYKKLRAEAESDAKGDVQLIFKPGDPVEWFSFGRKDAEADGWHPAFYLCKAGAPNYHVVQDIDGMYHVVNYANIRSPKAMYRPGDKVEALSFDGSRWEDAVVERTEVLSGQWHCTVRLASGERHCLPVASSVRRPSSAEAEDCEELVQKDAPQTPAELCRRIVDANPAIYGRAHKPTGEELAEMAREDA